MRTLTKIKRNLLRASKSLGSFELIGNGGWRQNRLLILGYHGVSITDEHIWNPGLYVAPEFLRRRFEIIKESGCTVLSLDEGLEHLYAGTLPTKAVVITFDDGAYDFYVRAVPLIKEFEFPATLYLTTFYAQYGK